MHLTSPRRAVARLVIALAALPACAGSFAQSAPPMPPMPTLPPPPHQATPGAALYPDYFALAMAHTHLGDDPAWRTLHLATPAGQAVPAFIVLPVQTQAYALPGTWRALVGAHLDQELQRRHVDATRQTDIVDWRGPFVRRTDDATIAAFAAEHPGSALLVLTLGHDAINHVFISLARVEDGRTRIAHRRLDIPQGPATKPDDLAAPLPAMLAELALGDARPAPALAAGEPVRCESSSWTLDDLPENAPPAATACHALLMGSLLPDFSATLWSFALPMTPDRMAWLARARVEAAALAHESAPMRSVAALASIQLGLDPAMPDPSALANDTDIVVRPLARMFAARSRTSNAPTVSRDEAARSDVESAIAGLPPFAAAIVREHSAFDESFHTADLCGMQLALPYFAVPRGCEDEAGDAPRPTRPASTGQRQLLDAWRVAAAWNDLYVEGHMRGSAVRLTEVENAIPSRIAGHPLIRLMRYSVRTTRPAPEDLEQHMAHARQDLADYLQAVATLQRIDPMENGNPLDARALLPAERQDATISHAIDDYQRLLSVQSLETLWGASMPWQRDRPGAQLAPFLADGPFVYAQMAAARAHGAGVGIGVGAIAMNFSPGSSPQGVVPKPGFRDSSGRVPRSRAQLEQTLAANPSDFPARLDLANVALENGAGVEAARRILDARPQSARVEDGIRETNDLVASGDLFFFSGEPEAARAYYERASRLEMGSGTDMLAKMRLAAIAGDPSTALKQAHAGSTRYQDEWFRADEAGYYFMLGRPDAAWRLLLPRMQTGRTAGFWRSAIAGHRMASTPLADLPDWIARNNLVLASHDGIGTAQGNWLRTYATLDRLPTDADIALLKNRLVAGKPVAPATGLLVVKVAIDGSRPTEPDALDKDMQWTWGSDRSLFMPFYAWAVWNATQGRDAVLDDVRASSLESGFARVLSKAMVLAADGRRDEALSFLTAARYGLMRKNDAGFDNEFLTASYDFVLATWLMSRKTGEPAYAEQGLAIARGYQRANEYMAWPYAAEALLGKDARARETAACRALWLDPGSMMLHESGLHPDAKSPACRKATAW